MGGLTRENANMRTRRSPPSTCGEIPSRDRLRGDPFPSPPSLQRSLLPSSSSLQLVRLWPHPSTPTSSPRTRYFPRCAVVEIADTFVHLSSIFAGLPQPYTMTGRASDAPFQCRQCPSRYMRLDHLYHHELKREYLRVSVRSQGLTSLSTPQMKVKRRVCVQVLQCQILSPRHSPSSLQVLQAERRLSNSLGPTTRAPEAGVRSMCSHKASM
jgi:hypothetical protein